MTRNFIPVPSRPAAGKTQPFTKKEDAQAARIGSMMGNPTGATYSVPVAFDHVVMIDRDIDDPSNWREEISLLRSATPFDRVHMQINTGGGMVSTAAAIVNAMKQCQATITTELVGDCCSAGTFIFLQGDEQIVNDTMGHFMIHQASHGYGGVDHQVYDYAVYSREQNISLVRDTYRGFLTEEEIEQAITGKEFWFTADEVSERCQHRMDLILSEDPEEQNKPTREVYEKMSKEDLLDAIFGPKEVSEEEIAAAVTRQAIILGYNSARGKTVTALRKEFQVPVKFKNKTQVVEYVMELIFPDADWQAVVEEETDEES